MRIQYLTLPSESASSFRKRFSSRESSSFENPLALRIAGDNAEFPIIRYIQFQDQFDCNNNLTPNTYAAKVFPILFVF